MGSLFSALTTAVSGLDAQASAIGNVSDNLANAQTTGYKAVQTNFEELVNASNATTNNPGGVTAQPEYQNDVQGSITSSNVVTNLAISGEGYFATQTASSTAGGSTLFNSEVFYTRAGDFTLDQNGYLVNGGGYYLDAWPVTNGVANSSIVQPVQVSALLNDPVPTSTISFQGNLPSNASVGYTADPSTVQIYDALGNSHDVTYTWSKTGTNTWDLTVNDADATGGGSPYSTVIPFSFNGSAPGTISSIGGTTAVGGSPYTVDTPTSAGSPAAVDIALDFAGATGAQTVTLNFGDYQTSSGLTQFSNADGTVTVTNFAQNGLASGSFNNFGISASGVVSINYSNGTNLAIAQIPIVQFFAQDQLQRVSGGAFTNTLSTGSPRFTIAGTNGAGSISSSSIEQSNVDIATEFTQLIQAQQVYSANAKVVTTDNSLLQVTINMIQ